MRFMVFHPISSRCNVKRSPIHYISILSVEAGEGEAIDSSDEYEINLAFDSSVLILSIFYITRPLWLKRRQPRAAKTVVAFVGLSKKAMRGSWKTEGVFKRFLETSGVDDRWIKKASRKESALCRVSGRDTILEVSKGAILSRWYSVSGVLQSDGMTLDAM